MSDPYGCMRAVPSFVEDLGNHMDTMNDSLDSSFFVSDGAPTPMLARMQTHSQQETATDTSNSTSQEIPVSVETSNVEQENVAPVVVAEQPAVPHTTTLVPSSMAIVNTIAEDLGRLAMFGNQKRPARRSQLQAQQETTAGSRLEPARRGPVRVPARGTSPAPIGDRPDNVHPPMRGVSPAPGSGRQPTRGVSPAPRSQERGVPLSESARQSSRGISPAPGSARQLARGVSPAPGSSRQPIRGVSPAPGSARQPARGVSPAPGSARQPARCVSPAPGAARQPARGVSPAPGSARQPARGVSPAYGSARQPARGVSPAPGSVRQPARGVSPAPVSARQPSRGVSPAPRSVRQSARGISPAPRSGIQSTRGVSPAPGAVRPVATGVSSAPRSVRQGENGVASAPRSARRASPRIVAASPRNLRPRSSRPTVHRASPAPQQTARATATARRSTRNTAVTAAGTSPAVRNGPQIVTRSARNGSGALPPTTRQTGSTQSTNLRVSRERTRRPPVPVAPARRNQSITRALANLPTQEEFFSDIARRASSIGRDVALNSTSREGVSPVVSTSAAVSAGNRGAARGPIAVAPSSARRSMPVKTAFGSVVRQAPRTTRTSVIRPREGETVATTPVTKSLHLRKYPQPSNMTPAARITYAESPILSTRTRSTSGSRTRQEPETQPVNRGPNRPTGGNVFSRLYASPARQRTRVDLGHQTQQPQDGTRGLRTPTMSRPSSRTTSRPDSATGVLEFDDHVNVNVVRQIDVEQATAGQTESVHKEETGNIQVEE